MAIFDTRYSDLNLSTYIIVIHFLCLSNAIPTLDSAQTVLGFPYRYFIYLQKRK